MSEELSSPFQLTSREFDIFHTACRARQKKLKADAERCRKSYSWKVSSETKAKEYDWEAEELDDLISKIAQEFS